MQPQAEAEVTKSFEKKPIKWKHEHKDAGIELQEILKRETPVTEHKAKLFPSTGDPELDKLCR